MNKNDMKSVVFLILALICFYYLMDDFIGKNKITNWITKFVGDFGGTAIPDPQTLPAADPAAAAAKTAPHASENLSPTKTPLVPIPKKNTQPKPQPQPKPKSGSGGFSLNDLIPHYSLPDLLNPFHSPFMLLPAAVAGETLSFPGQIKQAFGG